MEKITKLAKNIKIFILTPVLKTLSLITRKFVHPNIPNSLTHSNEEIFSLNFILPHNVTSFLERNYK